MAKPRIFVSSTYYDLKHLRSSLDNFIQSLGFESVLSEKGNIVYSPDTPLDESCYKEASNADIFVLIVGGRYGSATSKEEEKPSTNFIDKYESITKKEYESAINSDIPTYILIETNVYSEYHTFLRNKKNKGISYAHVDSENVFRLIEYILSKPRNNPVHTFERFGEIESWLKEQWSGLFRELLKKKTNQQQLSSLSSQVDALGAINETLKRYLERIVTKISPEEATSLIDSEQERLNIRQQLNSLKHNTFYQIILGGEDEDEDGIKVEEFREAILASKTFSDFVRKFKEINLSFYESSDASRDALDEAFKVLNQKLLPRKKIGAN